MPDLHFLHPWWLLGAALCAVAGVLHRRRRAADSPWHRVLDAKLAGALIRAHAGRFAFGAREWLWLLACLGMLALAGPSWSKQVPAEVREQALVLVLLGNGGGMYASDVAPNRNRAAKARIEALRRAMPQAWFGVIAYAGSAHLVIPPTRDDSFFELFLPPLEPDLMPGVAASRPGLGQALDLARKAMSGTALPANLVIMTDSLSPAERAELDEFHRHFAGVEVLAVGTAEGGPPRFAPAGWPAADNGLALDQFAALKAEGVAVTGLDAGGQDIAWLRQRIHGSLERAHNGDPQWHWEDAGYWLVLAMLPIALLLYRQLRVLGLALPLTLLLTGAYTPDARADWRDLWWTRDQQGQQALDRGNYRGAAERFADPYRRGRAYYLAEDYPSAAAAFAQVPSAQGQFYLGNSLARQQRYQAALKAYRQALLLDPGLAEASANAGAVQAVLDELAKRPGERQKAEPGDADVGSVRIELTPRHAPNDAAPAASDMSDDELNQWMSNVKSSPREMLKTLFLLQVQEDAEGEGE
ncbi:VWA domain-containing protein [Pseudomonas citronellolis]|uniref:VWA domain-containing protein n=1 Tax=Pseudomonas citronellolis TaxID=53408 RepID=UPI0023E44010|nr:VWA domain-containing protein [Pseudomonas citronellolis]MDF3935573.1 VWA domain-containing protein [Pseudomonas citronellolis]